MEHVNQYIQTGRRIGSVYIFGVISGREFSDETNIPARTAEQNLAKAAVRCMIPR